ncbi:UPF0060 membrane protein [Nymphaea thermarum]|nr:UPF0060 membrane protein [Nymphaea thermarum]
MGYDVGSLMVAVCLFVGAGVCEIGGGWLVWKWRREGWGWGSLAAGFLLLLLYGVVPTFQAQPFGRTYAAYGGFFIALSLLWGWAFDSFLPDRWDLLGSALALLGVSLVMFAPRGTGAQPQINLLQ